MTLVLTAIAFVGGYLIGVWRRRSGTTRCGALTDVTRDNRDGVPPFNVTRRCNLDGGHGGPHHCFLVEGFGQRDHWWNDPPPPPAKTRAPDGA